MNEGIQKGILDKTSELNENSQEHLDRVAKITKRLNEYISGVEFLTSSEIQRDIDELTGYTILAPVPIPLINGIAISRAVKYSEDTGCAYSDVQRLSYIPDNIGVEPSKGRLNQKGESIFYSCMNSDSNSLGTILSECRANECDIFNILQCKTKLNNPQNQYGTSLSVVPVGINDYFRRGVSTPFNLNSTFREMYELIVKNTHPTAMLAMQLCDAFLTDVLSRNESERLYDVTAAIAAECLKPEVLDGILYPSTKFEGFPNLAIKPTSVDNKLRYESALSIKVNRSFGYGMYQTTTLRQGLVNGREILWSSTP
ncbi:MAG: hypothetical protein PsegKO_31010 [Pseudohongiellaceae bacterium]